MIEDVKYHNGLFGQFPMFSSISLSSSSSPFGLIFYLKLSFLSRFFYFLFLNFCKSFFRMANPRQFISGGRGKLLKVSSFPTRNTNRKQNKWSEIEEF